VFGFGVCWELNLEPDIINCARRSAIGIGMCVERVEGLLNFKIVGGAGSPTVGSSLAHWTSVSQGLRKFSRFREAIRKDSPPNQRADVAVVHEVVVHVGG
jgi:hypothetical protein